MKQTYIKLSEIIFFKILKIYMIFFSNLRYSDFRLQVFPLQSTQRPCFRSECICNYQRQLEFNCFLTFCYINNYIYYNQRLGVKFKSNRLLFFFTEHTLRHNDYRYFESKF